MEEHPTEKRIDDLADRVGRFEANVDKRFDKIDARFDKIDARFDKIDARFDRWGRILGGAAVTIAGAVALKILGVDA